MAKIARYKKADFTPADIDLQANVQAILQARNEFTGRLKQRFITLASQIEQWDDPANEDALIVRLKGIVADNGPYTEQQLLNIGCILIALYNLEEE